MSNVDFSDMEEVRDLNRDILSAVAQMRKECPDKDTAAMYMDAISLFNKFSVTLIQAMDSDIKINQVNNSNNQKPKNDE